MEKVRIASLLITTVAVTAFAAPASALISAHLPGSGYYRHMTTTPKPTPSPPTHMSGGCCGGGHMSGSGHMSGGSYGGSGGHPMTWGGKPPLGTHPMGMHFYGMGGSQMKYGSHFSRHSYGMGGGLAKKYGMWWGGHAPGSGEGYHASGGSYGMHMPSGTHPMGLHFYGMSSGSLAAKYGQLQHNYGAMYGGSGGSGYGTQGSDSSGSMKPTYVWGSSPGGGGQSSHKVMSHFAYKFTSKRHYAYSSKISHKHATAGTWGSSGPSHWTYGMK